MRGVGGGCGSSWGMYLPCGHTPVREIHPLSCACAALLQSVCCAEFTQMGPAPYDTTTAPGGGQGQAAAETAASGRDWSWCPQEESALGLAMHRVSAVEGTSTNRHRLVQAKKEYAGALDLVTGEHRSWEQGPKPQRSCPSVEQSLLLAVPLLPGAVERHHQLPHQGRSGAQ